MKKIQFWILILVLTLALTLPGAALANDTAQNPPPTALNGQVQTADEDGNVTAIEGASIETVASNYIFSQSSGTYTEIVSGTVHGTASNDDTSFPAIGLGFTFYYNGLPYTQVSIQSNGWIAMGPAISSTYYPLSTGTNNNVIAALARDLQGNGTNSVLMSKMEGSSPNRVFTIQWSHYKRYGTAYVGDDFNFQIKLYETSDLVEVVYGPFTVLYVASPPYGPQVGLRGSSNADFNNRTTTTDWTASTAGTTNADSMALTDLIYPPSGLTFDWTVPPYVGLEPNYAGSGCRGSTVDYPLTAFNFTSLTDTLDIATSGFAWPTTAYPASLVLAPKGSGTVTASVYIPWAAAVGSQNGATVTATGQNSGLSGSATLSTKSVLIGGYTDYANVPVGREVRAPSVVYWDGRLYKIGGYGYVAGTGAARAWLDIYDIATDTWTSGADMPAARYWINCEVIDLTGTEPKIYCAGGYLSSAQNTLYIYDINTNTWTSGATLPANRYDYASAVYNNLYYVIGGYTTAYQATMLVYDPVTNTWDGTKAPMSVARRYFHAGVIGDKIYVAGGYNGSYLSSAEVYDIASNTWSPIAPMPSPWLNAADGVKHDRYLLLYGGSPNSTSGASNGALIYDSLTNTWEWLPLLDRLLYGAEGDSDGTNFWVASGRMYDGSVWSNSPYTTLADQCTDCTPVSGADFTVDPIVPRPNMPAIFTANVTGGSPTIIYDWDFGDGTTGFGAVLTHTYDLAATYTVIMTATNCDGANLSVVTHDVLVEAGPIANISPLFLDATQCPDCQTEQTINVCNEGDTDLVWDLTETAGILGGHQSGVESLSGSFVVFDPTAGGNDRYVPGTPQTFCFRAETFTTDWEYRYFNWLKFPADWTVSNVYVAGTPVCDSGSTWGAFSWSFETAPYEVSIFHPVYNASTDHCVATYCVDVTSGAGGGPAPVSWFFAGDGYGAPPHYPCSADQYTPPSMAPYPCDEWVNPRAYIPDVSALSWLYETPTSGTVIPGTCEVVTVTFDSATLLPGLYTGTLEIETNDSLNPLVDIPVSLTVAGPPTNPSFSYMPAAPMIGQEVTFNGLADALVPVDFTWDFGDGTTGTGQNPTHAYADYGTFIVSMTATECSESVVVTGTVTVAPCYSFLTEDFESSFPPVNWTVVNNGGTCVWTRNDAFATPRPNYAGGLGFAADADSDKCGSGTTMDTELRTMTLDLSEVQTATLQYVTAYNDIGVGGDFADVDVSVDGGTTWTNLLHWDEDHSANGPGELVTLDLTSYAGYSNVMLRYHYYLATYDWWWEVDQVSMAGCIVPGAVPDIAVTPLVLTQTLQTNQTADQTFNIANNGLAWLDWTADVGCGTPVNWLSTTPTTGTLSAYSNTDVTATFDSTGLAVDTYVAPICVNSNDPDSPTVQVIATLIVTGTPDIDVTMPVLDVTLPPDSGTTLTGTICNVGDATLHWALSEIPASLLAGSQDVMPAAPPAPPPEIFRLPDGSVDCAAYQNYAGFEPAEVATACRVDLPASRAASPLAPTDIGYAQDIGYISDNFVSFQLNDFTGQTIIGTSTNAYYGMDFDPAAEVLYALNDTTDQLGTIDLTTGAFTGLVSCPPGGGAANWTGLSIDPSTGVFYASTATNLYIIDPLTGASTLVGPFGTTLMIEIAVNMDGQMYGHDIGTDSIYSIDMTTGAATLIGLTGYLANFAQGMDFDNNDGTLYIFLYIGSGANVYGTVNLATGAVTPLAVDAPLGEFEGATQTAGAALDIPWLSESPISGTLLAGECTDEDVTYDSTGLNVGVYTGDLLIESDDPDEGEITLPVTLTVIPQADLAVEKSDLVDPVMAGLEIDYTLLVTNNGPTASFGSLVTDTLPAGVDFVSASPVCTVDVSVVTCTLGSLAVGESATITITAVALDPGLYLNTVDVVGVDDDPDLLNNHAEEETTVLPYQVNLVYYDLEDVVHAGESIYVSGEWNGWSTTADPLTPNADYSVFTVTLELGMRDYAYDYAVYTDTLPSGPAHLYWLQSYPDNSNRTMGITGDVTIHDYRDIVPGYWELWSPDAITVTVGMTTEDIHGRLWAWVFTSEGVEPRSLIAELGFGTALDPAAWTTWASMLWDSQVGNDADHVGNITPTEVGVFSYAVRYNANWGVDNPNNAWYYGDTLWDGVYNPEDAGVLTVLETVADLSLLKEGPGTVTNGETFTYTLTVENLGPDAAVNVLLTDTLPLSVTFVSATAPCMETGGVVTCGLGDIAADGSVVIEIVVIAPETAGTLTNTAVVASDTSDPDETNNTDSLDTIVEVVVTVYRTYLTLILKN
jgi:uncharacterized repeat protein (TIGR01451 family)